MELSYFNLSSFLSSVCDSRLKHPNIVQLIEVIDEKSTVYLVMEL